MYRSLTHCIPLTADLKRGDNSQAQSCVLIQAQAPDRQRPEHTKLIVLHHN